MILGAVLASSEENEGSADSEIDDEDLVQTDVNPGGKLLEAEPGEAGVDPVDTEKTIANPDKQKKDEFIIIVIVASVGVVGLILAIVAAVLVKRRMDSKRQQGVYSVPTEQGQKVKA